MELQDYIAETLVQITNGITDAQERLKETDAIVNPGRTFGSKGNLWVMQDEMRGGWRGIMVRRGLLIGI